MSAPHRKPDCLNLNKRFLELIFQHGCSRIKDRIPLTFLAAVLLHKNAKRHQRRNLSGDSNTGLDLFEDDLGIETSDCSITDIDDQRGKVTILNNR